MEKYILTPSEIGISPLTMILSNFCSVEKELFLDQILMRWHWYVYIIECKDNTYYTGRSWNVELRYDQHLSGLGSKYTAKHGVKKLAYYEMHEDFEAARTREVQIKGWNQEKKKKILIDNFHPEGEESDAR